MGAGWNMGNSIHLSIFFLLFSPFTVGMVRYWNRLPKEVAEFLSLELHKMQLDEALL